MPRMTDSEKQYRKELSQHMWHMHGEFRNVHNLTVDELEKLHGMMHIDGYSCPKHHHLASDDPFKLGKIKLHFGKKYIDEMVEAIRYVR